MSKKNIGLVCTLVLLANAAVVPTVATQAATGETTPVTATAQPVATSTPATATANESIDQWMPNKTLQQAVLRALNGYGSSDPTKKWTSVDQITPADMQYLTRLSEGNITHIDGTTSFSLQGLQYATNLTELMLQSNVSTAYYGDITDVSPLAGLTKLTDLQLTGNRITDVTPLAGLTNLTQLGLAFNHIKDFSSLSNLTKTSISYANQFVLLPTISVNNKTRTSHLNGGFRKPDGSLAPLSVTSGILAEPVVFDSNSVFHYRIYNLGGNATPTSDGGLDYSYIQNQKPSLPEGLNSVPNHPEIYNVPVPDYYYMIGTYIANGQVVFSVAQPYSLADSAADVTVNYQDEAGNELADSETLTGLVGDDYQSEMKTIPGYTFKEVKDNNATGKFTDAAQTVTYV